MNMDYLSSKERTQAEQELLIPILIIGMLSLSPFLYVFYTVVTT